MSDPTIEAARSILRDSLDAMREAIAGASPETLNWRPGGADTNTIAILATHSINATRTWLSVATGAPLPDRDRPSEFLTTADSAEKQLARFDALARQCMALLDAEARFDAGAIRETLTRDEGPVTAAWALLHAIEHLQEHVAHAQLTRQLWEYRDS